MPTFRHGKNTTVLSDDFDLTTYLNSASAAYSVDVPETTTFGSSDRSYIVGHNEGTLSFEGLFDGTTDSADSIFHAALGNTADKVITVSNDSTAIGGRAILAAAASTSALAAAAAASSNALATTVSTGATAAATSTLFAITVFSTGAVTDGLLRPNADIKKLILFDIKYR